MSKAKYTYEQVIAMIENSKETSSNGYLILESELDITPEDGKRLMKLYDVRAEPSSPDSYWLKIIYNKKQYKAFGKRVKNRL